MLLLLLLLLVLADRSLHALVRLAAAERLVQQVEVVRRLGVVVVGRGRGRPAEPLVMLLLLTGLLEPVLVLLLLAWVLLLLVLVVVLVLAEVLVVSLVVMVMVDERGGAWRG